MSEKDKLIIGKNLKYLRKLKGLTQQELANHLGIRRSSIGAYEECRATPKYETLEKISDFFQVSIDLLVKEAKQAASLGIPAVALFPVTPQSAKSLTAEEVVITPTATSILGVLALLPFRGSRASPITTNLPGVISSVKLKVNSALFLLGVVLLEGKSSALNSTDPTSISFPPYW